MELVVFGCLLMCIAATSAYAQTCAPPSCFVNGTTEIQCNNCPVGVGVAVENKEFMTCRSSPTPRNTKCEPCIAGVNFSDTNDSTSKCGYCLSCHSTKEVQTKECTVDSDAVCACKEGSFYRDFDLQTCLPCTVCGEGTGEISLCTPTQDRDCGAQSTPVASTTNPTTPTPTPTPNGNTTNSGTGISTDTGISKGPTKGNAIPAWGILLIVLFIIILLMLIGLWYYKYARSKNRGDSSDGQNSNDRTPCCSIMINDCCIGNQTNTYDTSRNASNGVQQNGNARQYHQVPSGIELNTGSEPNGVPVVHGQNHVTTTTTTTTTMDEVDPLRSVGEALGLSAAKLEHLIQKLDEPDDLGRNAFRLAESNLDLSTDGLNRIANSSSKAADILDLWVKQGRTKEDLVLALRDMGRDDIADDCEEDSAGS